MGYKVYMAEVIHPDAVKKLSEFAEIVDNFDHIILSKNSLAGNVKLLSHYLKF